MTNARTELQYRISLDLAEQARGAGLLTAEETTVLKRIAAERYRPVTVRE